MKKSQLEIINLIKTIPKGNVATYGQIASLAGLYPAVRQVVWALHSSSEKEDLPWHRVVNRFGGISLKPGEGYEKQRGLLIAEGIVFDERDRIDLDRFLWEPTDSGSDFDDDLDEILD
jgi:methylated-DNA-protein-cysteine methyltransferase related protein